MYVQLQDDTDIRTLILAIGIGFNETRFDVRNIRNDRGKRIVVSQVFLKDSKEWCGSHPNACEIIERSRKARWLEGADWVEFNDRLNDVLDALSIEARVYATRVPVEIRDGLKRRINYDSHIFNANHPIFGVVWEWDKDGEEDDYEDWCGKVAPNSTWPEGTPGLYLRNVDEKV